MTWSTCNIFVLTAVHVSKIKKFTLTDSYLDFEHVSSIILDRYTLHDMIVVDWQNKIFKWETATDEPLLSDTSGEGTHSHGPSHKQTM